MDTLDKTENTHTVQTVFIFGLLAVLFILIACMMYPFWSIILWTILLYILLRPFYQKCIGRLNKDKKSYSAKRHFFAGLFAIGTLILIIGPLILLSFLLTRQLMTFLSSAEQFLQTHFAAVTSENLNAKIATFIEKTGLTLPNFDFTNVRGSVLSLIHTYSSKVFSFGTSVLSRAGTFVVSLLFIVFALYFCFLDGAYLGSMIKKAIPIKPSYMKVLTTKFTEITKSLFSGYILVALYQGAVSFIIMFIFRIQGALLFSVVLMLASFVPLFGAALVWFPVGIVICFTQSIAKGIVFLIVSGICISFLDNFLRPLFLKDRIHVHPLIIFFAILGGLKFFGINGLILGPMIVILFFTVLDLLVSTKEENLPQETETVKNDTVLKK